MEITDKISTTLNVKGLKKKWLAEKLGMTPTGLGKKFKTRKWSNSELFYMQALLGINLGVKA